MSSISLESTQGPMFGPESAISVVTPRRLPVQFGFHPIVVGVQFGSDCFLGTAPQNAKTQVPVKGVPSFNSYPNVRINPDA